MKQAGRAPRRSGPACQRLIVLVVATDHGRVASPSIVEARCHRSASVGLAVRKSRS